MLGKKKYRMGKKSGDRLVCASKVADKKIKMAIKPIRIPELKKRLKR